MRDRLVELLKEIYPKTRYIPIEECREKIADYLLDNGVIVHDFRETDKKEETLKCCPFCGSTNVVLRHGAMFNGAVHCLDCTADVVFDAVRLIKDGDYNWQAALTKGWNKRAGKEGGEG